MLNNVVMVGRILEDPTLEEGKVNITLAVQRSYKNEEGIYEIDNIPLTLFGVIAGNAIEYCKKGDMIGAKGRLQIINDKLCVIADKITFLASRKTELQNIKTEEE